ncbi:EAL domain-containing protein [Klebsiella aerogenes]|uniref:EAL domain-containing protein n=1 Tax=Klebsiella aerogenes TaxID=548 RepID=UPI002A6B6206|nr:EAL domain-containing protein [Klebsiella aerogenes]MDY0846640.1 EAL domain-containing protein [Klebsiella aerogenes]WPS34075.1 EAL domain-containing protein [Klebsiella aerogenes]
MSTSKADTPQATTDYILSPCAMAAAGLARMVDDGCRQSIWLQPRVQSMLSIPAPADVRQIVVFLPDDPWWLLFVLREAACLLTQAKRPLPMVILSRSPAPWLWQTLLHQVGDRRLLAAVQAISSDLPCRRLAALLKGGLVGYPTLQQLSAIEALARGKPPSGLSKIELNATLALLYGHSITSQAQIRGVSQKTLYNQRTSGLNKMVEYHPHLASRFPGSRSKRVAGQGMTALTPFEREFIHAIHSRQIFPVFQPIVDDRLRLQGIEILSRWRKDGVVLPPGEFLPHIRSEYAWLLLTAFVLQEAVQNINRYQGEFYFSVNIPPCIAHHDNLARMMETAWQQLQNPLWADRLVLEFAETVDLQQQGKAVANMSNIQQQGFRIFLDDCFSHSSVMFPVRTARFSGYKLDMSIVDDFQRDPHALVLIKSLVYYCQLTQSRCIAEGVDSLEKFNQLKALGVDRFQGYLFSPPVTREHLGEIIQRFLPDHATCRLAG